MADTVKASANLTDTNSAEARARRRREKQANLSASEKLKSNATVVVAVIAGVITSLVKFVAASITGSSAMFSEGIQNVMAGGHPIENPLINYIVLGIASW